MYKLSIRSQHSQIHSLFQTSMIMMEHRFKGKVLWSKLVRNMSTNTLYYLTNEVDREDGCGIDKSKYDCLIFITYKLVCACTISKKIKLNTPLFI